MHPDGFGSNVTDGYTLTRMADLPDENQLSRYFSMMGKKGGKARFAKMTPEQRKELATKASKAAAIARSKKARQKRTKKNSA